MFNFFREQVYIGFHEDAFERTKRILTAAGIAFTEKISAPSDRWAGSLSRGRGGFGINDDYAHQYELWVAAADFEQAKYLLKGRDD